jgi:hypothetical protein
VLKSEGLYVSPISSSSAAVQEEEEEEEDIKRQSRNGVIKENLPSWRLQLLLKANNSR